MFRFVVLNALIACVLSAVIPEGLEALSEGATLQRDGRIVGGAYTTISSFPYQISLQRSGFHLCGGAIYNNKIIVTAAHCLQSGTAYVLRVRAGSTYWSSGGVLIEVSAFKYHEGYNPNTKNNDIAVIRLATSLSYGALIKPITLAESAPANGAAATVAGWGATKPGHSSVSPQLSYVDTKIVSRAQCSSGNYGYAGKIYGTMICASSTGKDSCQGDSGGGLVSGGVLVGVVSWGVGCALDSYPGVYADVAALKPWVQMAALAV